MSFKKRSAAIKLLTGVLTLCVMLGTAFVGVYPAVSANAVNGADDFVEAYGNSADSKKTAGSNPGNSSRIARCYESDSLPLFQFEFSRLSEDAQAEWLERIYADGKIAYMGAAVTLLEEDCAPIQHLAETIYKDGNTAFFAALAMHMSEEALEAWLERAMEDENWAFQSMLYNALDWDDEFDELEEQKNKEWAEAQAKEYRSAGITIDGKNYYYQGQLVDIFLDIRSNKSFYTLNMNPKGTVSIQVVRGENNEITGVSYMTEAEVRELLGEMNDPDENADVEMIPVDFKTVADGETILLGEYTLSHGDEIWYDITAETGNRMKVFFAEDARNDVVYWSVNSLRRPGESLDCIADFTVEPSAAKPGTYKLYLQAPDGALGNVRGCVSIAPADAS